MKRYIDEYGGILTENQLRADYSEQFATDEYFRDLFPTFSEYLRDCCGKNGTLTIIE